MKNWKVWNNVFPNFIFTADCDNTDDGICEKNLTLQQCIDKSSPESSYGTFITLPNGNTICGHNKTDFYQKHINYNMNIVPKDIEKGLKDVDIDTFIDTDKNPWPPQEGMNIFFRDFLSLRFNTNENLYLSRKIREPLQFEKYPSTETHKITLIPVDTYPQNLVNISKVLYGDKVYVVVPGTNLMLQSEDGSNMIWNYSSRLREKHSFFLLPPIGSKKKIGDPIKHKDPIRLVNSFTSKAIVRDKQNILRVNEDGDDVFYFESQMTCYYCDNGVCKSTSVKDVPDNLKDKVERKDDCWGCDTSKSTLDKPYAERVILTDNDQFLKKDFWSDITILLLISIVVFFIVMYITKKMIVKLKPSSNSSGAFQQRYSEDL